jgi:hypothetical protein
VDTDAPALTKLGEAERSLAGRQNSNSREAGGTGEWSASAIRDSSGVGSTVEETRLAG